eukprot:scaffold142942_cov19-Tisochrysis_lutea.AAC.3
MKASQQADSWDGGTSFEWLLGGRPVGCVHGCNEKARKTLRAHASACSCVRKCVFKQAQGSPSQAAKPSTALGTHASPQTNLNSSSQRVSPFASHSVALLKCGPTYMHSIRGMNKHIKK